MFFHGDWGLGLPPRNSEPTCLPHLLLLTGEAPLGAQGHLFPSMVFLSCHQNPGWNRAGGSTKGTETGAYCVCVGAQPGLAAVRLVNLEIYFISPKACNFTW